MNNALQNGRITLCGYSKVAHGLSYFHFEIDKIKNWYDKISGFNFGNKNFTESISLWQEIVFERHRFGFS